MSEVVHYIGKAKEVETDLDLEDFAGQIVRDRNIKYREHYDSNLQCLSGELYKEYFYHNKSHKLYEIDYKENETYEDIIRASYTEGGDVSFELKYYNGGAGFGECLEDALDKLPPKNNVNNKTYTANLKKI